MNFVARSCSTIAKLLRMFIHLKLGNLFLNSSFFSFSQRTVLVFNGVVVNGHWVFTSHLLTWKVVYGNIWSVIEITISRSTDHYIVKYGYSRFRVRTGAGKCFTSFMLLIVFIFLIELSSKLDFRTVLLNRILVYYQYQITNDYNLIHAVQITKSLTVKISWPKNLPLSSLSNSSQVFDCDWLIKWTPYFNTDFVANC
jgi:hypothetical protein